ncbi:NF038132 family protein [Ideonella sp. A 288]|uniref:NF038132 family protein n=1 Tax=Ideonella sp. A 288 TaxID=1962181 RepID=UPI000B4AA0D7|nr:NF038132 family protein [Ideonella sp. A 288]
MKQYAPLALITFAALASPVAQAVEVSLAGATWSSTGATGLITSNYNGETAVPLSPTGNAKFGFVTTFNGVATVPPLALNPGDGGETETNGSKVLSSTFTASVNDTLKLRLNFVSTDGRGFDDYAWARLVNVATGNTAAWLFTARSGNAPDGDGTGDYVPGKVLSDQVDKQADKQLDAVLNGGVPIVHMPGGTNTNWSPLGVENVSGSYGFCWAGNPLEGSCGSSGWVTSDYSFTAGGTFRVEIGVTNFGDEAYDTALAFDFTGLSQANFAGATVLENPPPPVPEPGTWALMLAGLGVAGLMARRHNKATAA